MAIRKTVVEENIEDPRIIRKTNTIVNPNIHTPVVDMKEDFIDGPNSSEIIQSKTIHEPLVKADHPQHVYETKKAIFKSWQFIWFFLILIEVLLVLRMAFKAIGANSFSGFVSLIYGVTDILVMPFMGIIPSTTNNTSIIEWSTIVAAVVYALIAWGIISLIHMARPVTPEEVDQAV